MSAPLIVGLTGPSGGGKSTAAEMLRTLHFCVIDCDSLSREAVRQGGECLKQLTERFGGEILLADGSLDRRRLGNICFSEPESKRALDDITHPHILRLLFERIRHEAENGADAVIVEAAALYESGLDRSCDRIALVRASRELLVNRIMQRDGLSAEAAAARLDAQTDARLLAERADYIIENDGSTAELEKAVNKFADTIKLWTKEVLMSKEKTKSQLLAEKLLRKPQSCFEKYSEEMLKSAREYSGGYMSFLDSAKTEREAVSSAVEMLKKHGFAEFDPKKKYSAGDKVYLNNRGKALVAAVVGSGKAEDGVSIIAAHVDSPRLDLKPCPLYEDKGLVYFKTHYYGGIKKYQWTAIPLALHGVVVDGNGNSIQVKIGEDDSDPVLYITNLLPHLSATHNERKATDIVKGEELNALLGSTPFDTEDETKDAFKLNIMNLLHEKYGITEDDFVTAELELVPAVKSRYVGLDRGLIASYGHDDRVCAYPALTALLETQKPARTCMCVFADKEETGSDGNTGMQGDYLKNFIIQITAATDPDADICTVFRNSRAISSDVTAAIDPTYADVMDPRNCSVLNYGPSVDKYGGSRGKYGCNDASAEYVGSIARIFNEAGLCWQTGELGKVDAGGGGTVAKFISVLDIDVVDCGVPMLSMHSPYELASVYDIYSFHLCCAAFYNN